MAEYNFSDLVKEVKAGSKAGVATDSNDSFRQMVKEVKQKNSPSAQFDFSTSPPAGVEGPVQSDKVVRDLISQVPVEEQTDYLKALRAQHPTALDNVKSLAMELPTGLANVGTALWKAADFFIPDDPVANILGVENKVGKFFDNVYAANAETNRQQAEYRAKADEWAAKVGEYVVSPVAQALPNAVVALMSGGTSLAGQGAAALGTAANAGSTATIISNTAKDMLSNPSFWSSFAQTVGPTYFEAKENGASEIEASATALLNAFAGSAIEVGGGIETLPNTTMGVRQWVRSMLDEGKEEVLQGAMEGLISKAVYDKDREWFALTDPDAIFSGSRALQEFAGGMTVGGILGGSQIGTAKAVEAIQSYSAAVKVGNVYLSGASGQTLDKAVQIGLSNAKGTDVYRAAEAIQQKAANGERVSPYAVGKMVVDSFTPAARQARALDTQVRQSAQAFGLDEQTADAVARIAVAAGRQVEFVAPEQLQVVGANGVSTAEGRYTDGKVQLNAAMPAERLTGYLIKHELTHAIENTKEWAQLEQIVRSSYGDAAFEAAKTAVAQRYAANNTQLTPEGAAREVVAQWVGDNLFKEGFAQALASGDASVGNAFLQALDKIRLALGGTKNSRTAGNIAMVERLFMRALENKNDATANGQAGAESAYSIKKDANGDVFVDVEGDILTGVPEKDVPKTLSNIIQNKFHNLIQVNGQNIVVNQRTNKEWRMSNNAQTLRANNPQAYADKIQAFNNADELLEASRNYVGEALKHSRKDDFVEFARGVVDFRVGGNGYSADVIVGTTKTGRAILYDIINLQTKQITDPSNTSQSFRQTDRHDGSVTDTTVPQNGTGVNSYDMQNGGENSQFSFGGVNGTDINIPYEGELTTPPPSDDGTSPDKGRLREAQTRGVEVAAPYDGGAVETANSQALQNLETASGGDNSTFPYISMVDFANSESGVWRNVDYNDETTKSAIMRETHQKMVDEGAVVVVNDAVLKRVDESFPDLRSMKKKERTPILREAMSNLKTNIRQFLNGFKNYSFEFEVNGNILDAKLYNTGINEVVEKVTKEKAGMLYASDEIFTNARYLYSTPDYDGDPNVYRWNYFYTPVQIGEKVVGVRIAVRDMVQGTDGHTPESQIYNWGIKKDASLDGGSYGPKVASSDVSSDTSAYSIRNPEENVKENSSTGFAEVEVQGQEIPEGTAGATETVYQPEAVPSRENERKKVAQGRTIEELEQELSDRELFNRAYMSEVIDRPPQTVEIGGQEVDSAAYMDMVEETIPDTEEGIEAFIADVSQRRADEVVRRYDETGEVSGDTTAAALQLLAADRKLTRIRLSEGETDGKVMRRFFEQRLKNLDANDTHAAEMVEYLAGRDERYNPISNAKTLEKAKERLKDPAYALKLERRIKHHKPGDVMSDVDAAAAQVMINDAKNSGKLELFSDLIQGLSRYGTDLGRAVQILSLQKRLTPEGTIRAAERTMNKAIDAQHGEGASDSMDQVSGTITEAIERAAAVGQSGILPTFEEDASFSGQIDEWKTLNKTGYVTVGAIQAGSPLHQIGLPTGKLYFDVSKIQKAMTDHSDHLSTDILKKVPELLKHPIAIVEYKPGEGTNTVNVYGNLYYHGRPITVGIVVTVGRDNTVITKVRMVHARGNFAKQITDDSILYLGENKKETDSWFQAQGQRVPMRGTIYGFIRSIAHPFGDVKARSVEEAESALGDAITAQKSPYISEEQIREIIHRAVDGATNIPQHVKKMLQDPAVQKTLAEKIAYIHQQGHLSDGAVCTAMKQALGVPSLNTEDVAHLIQLVDAMQATEEGTLAREDATEEIYRFLGEKLPTSFVEGLMSWRKFAMLANPKTHLRNISANLVMMGGVNKLDSAFSTVFQRLFLQDEAKRTAYFGWRSSEHGKQLLQNTELFAKQTEKALARLRGDEKYEFTNAKLARYKKTFGKSRVGEFFNKLNDKNSDLLERQDAFSFRRVFVDALGQIMIARGVSEVDADIFEAAYQKAAEAVFRADNAMATVLSQLKQGMYDVNTSKGKKALGYIADIVIPFSKTPANIAVSSFQHSPLGYLKSGYDLVQTLRNAPNAKAMADVLNGFAKNTTGTVLWILGLLLGSLGLFNTGYGKTEKERAADELAGIQENAFVIGDTSFTMDWLQPAVAPLIVGASIAQRFREEGLSLSAFGGALMDGTDSLFELTMLQSLYDVLGGYDAGASASAASIAENVVSQSIPTLLGQAARAIDPVQRKTRGDNDFETILNQVMAKVPGLTYLLEPELDVWGDEVYRTGKASGGTALLNTVQQFLLPSNVKVGTGKGDALSQAVLELYNSGADRAGRALPTSVTRDEAREMDVAYDELFRIVAQMQREKAEELMSDKVSYSVQTEGANGKKRTVQKRWSQMTEDEQLRVMNRVYSEVKSSATDPDEAFYDEIIGRLRNGN